MAKAKSKPEPDAKPEEEPVPPKPVEEKPEPEPPKEPEAKAKPKSEPDGLYRYEVNCKGVGLWHVDLPGEDLADDAQEAYLAHFGIVATDHAIRVGEPQPVE